MARFVGMLASVGVRDEVLENFARNQKHRKGLEAVFTNDLTTDEDVEAVERHPVVGAHGLPFDKEAESLVSPRSRVRVFDSRTAQSQNGWSDEDHDLVVDALRKRENGFGIDYFESELAGVEAPWATYDEMEDPEQIVFAIESTGVDPSLVLTYEQENKARAEVIEAIEGLVKEEPVSIEA